MLLIATIGQTRSRQFADDMTCAHMHCPDYRQQSMLNSKMAFSGTSCRNFSVSKFLAQYMYAYVCTCMCMMYACVRMYIYMRIYVYVCIMYVCMHVCVYAYIYICIYMYIYHVRMCGCIYTYTRTCVYCMHDPCIHIYI